MRDCSLVSVVNRYWTAKGGRIGVRAINCLAQSEDEFLKIGIVEYGTWPRSDPILSPEDLNRVFTREIVQHS